MRTQTPTIVGTGLFALDVILRADGSAPTPTLGGSAGNVLCILGALGWNSTPVGVLGKDGAASTVWREFERVEADTRFLMQTEERSTPVIYQHQLSSELGATHRFSFSCPKCGEGRRPFWDCDDRLEAVRSELPSANVFFLDRPTKLGVTLAEQYSEAGAIVVFEPSAVGEDVDLFCRALRSADIVKYAEDRFDALTGFELPESAVEIQTRGSRGLRFRVRSAGEEWTDLRAYDVPYLRDTSGAGDWCTAGLVFELFCMQGSSRARLDNHSFLSEALAFGQVLSTLNCMTEGARGLLSTWTPDHIVRFAHELREARLHSDLEASSTMNHVSDPKLLDLVDEFSSLSQLQHLGGHRFCCSLS
jgi:sugar/nucleoside kinase (ribokinase family)